jgi:hypothetical protein
VRRLESRDSLPVIPKHDSFDMVERRVESIQRRVHAIESPRDPQGLQAGERRKG